MHLPWRHVDGISTSLTTAETQRLRELAVGSVVLEIGSAYGFSAIQMAQAGALLVVAVDPHAGENSDSYAVMCANLEQRNILDAVLMFRATSQDALPLFEAESFDLVFVDGDHSEQGVAHDVREAWRLLRPEGTLACHDYGEDSCGGVRVALDGWDRADELVDTLWIKRKG